MKTLFAFLTFLLCNIMATAQPWLFNGKYPETKTVAQVDSYFLNPVPDPYRWLEDDRSAETKEWVKAQNKFTQNYLSRIPYRDALKKRLTSLWNYEKYSSPFMEGAYLYYYKNDGLQSQSVLYRQPVSAATPPEIFLDPNKFSKDGTTSLGGIDFSNDGSLAAYQISEGGSDWRKVIVVKTQTKSKIEDTLYDIKFSGISWHNNDGFYYSRYDKPKEGSQLSGMTQFHKLYYHKLGTPQKNDVFVFGGNEKPRRYIGGSVTEDQNYLIISAANSTYGNELYIKDLNRKNAPIVPIVTGFDNEHDVVHSEGGKLYIVTSLDAPNHKLVSTEINTPGTGNWKVLIPETKFPMTASTFGHKLFAHYLLTGVSQVLRFSLDGRQEGDVMVPGIGTLSGLNGKMGETVGYFVFSSYLSPPVIYKYSLDEPKPEIFKRSNLTLDFDQYITVQTTCKSKDGTEIPITLTYKKYIERNGKNPLLLYGYGGFNISLTPSFSISNMMFLENGGVYAVANLRGGGEYGEAWHQAGTKLKKQNVFDDFIAAAEYLIKEKYTSSSYLTISGGSNGGLLVGACMTQRPDLYRVCLPAVGVLDMLRYNKFTAGAGWASDYGTAEDSPEMFNYLRSYSPLHNVKNNGSCYPSTMITTGDHDDRVVPAHSFKFAATLQAYQACQSPILINIETKAGHGAGKSTAQQIQEQADKWAFLFFNMDTPDFIPKF
jgi:prolyl oligopeptidase